jgi:hypothetical protein
MVFAKRGLGNLRAAKPPSNSPKFSFPLHWGKVTGRLRARPEGGVGSIGLSDLVKAIGRA